jgi:hypothetical protein
LAALVFEDERCLIGLDRIDETGERRWHAIGAANGGSFSSGSRITLMRSPSSIITEEQTMAKDEFAAVTPGEMLKEEFLAEYGLSQNQLAKTIGI